MAKSKGKKNKALARKAKLVLKIGLVLVALWGLGAVHIEDDTVLGHLDDLLNTHTFQPAYDKVTGLFGVARSEFSAKTRDLGNRLEDTRDNVSKKVESFRERKQNARKQMSGTRKFPQGTSLLRNTHGSAEPADSTSESPQTEKNTDSSVANSPASGIEFSKTPQAPLGDTSSDDNAMLEAIIDQHAE